MDSTLRFFASFFQKTSGRFSCGKILQASLSPSFGRIVALLLLSVLGAFQAQAQAQDSISQSELALKLAQRLNVDPKNITYLPKVGVYEVVVGVRNPEIIYVSKNGDYIMRGKLYDIQQQPFIDLSAKSNIKMYEEDLKRLVWNASDDNFVVFPAKGRKKHTVHAFTDVFCPYCHSFHRETVLPLVEQGVEVRYIAFPVVQPHRSVPTMEAIWCESSQAKRAALMASVFENKKALTSNPKCKDFANPYIELGKDLGARGTPFVLLRNGQTYNGAVKPDILLQELERATNNR